MVHSLLHTSKMHFPIQVREISQQKVQYTTLIAPFFLFYFSLIIDFFVVSSKIYIVTRIFSKCQIPLFLNILLQYQTPMHPIPKSKNTEHVQKKIIIEGIKSYIM